MARKKRKKNSGFFNKINRQVAKYVDSAKAIFGKPATDPGHQALINTNTAQFNITSNRFEEWVREAYEGNEVINRALNLIMNTVCEAPLNVYDEEGKILDTHPTQLLLHHINDSETQKQFLKRLLLYMFLGDVGYVQKVFTRGGKVTELGLLRPDKVKVSAVNNIGTVSYTYQPNGDGNPYELSNREVIPVQFIDPASRLSGFSPLKSLSKRVDTDNEHTNHTMAVLQNGGVPGSILKVSDALDRDQATDLALSFDQRVSGGKKGSTIVLHGGVEYETVGGSFKDLEAKELAKVNEAKILSALGIPLPVFGGISGTDASTFDNMRTAVKIFWRQTIIPLQSMLEDYFNGDMDLLPKQDQAKGICIKFDRSNVEALKEDQDLLSLRAREDYKSGLITLNEARSIGGFEPLEDGDSLFSPFPSFEAPQAEDNEEDEESDQEELKQALEALNEARISFEDFKKSIDFPKEEEHCEEFTAEDYQEEVKASVFAENPDLEVSLRNSEFKQFDHDFAVRIKEEYPSIWKKGGNIRGNGAFRLWSSAKDKKAEDLTQAEKDWIREREAWMARHEKDKRIAGVVAVMKWGGIVTRGEKYMKDLIREEIAKLDKKSVDESPLEAVNNVDKEDLEKKIKDFEIATKRMNIADKFSFEFFKLARKHLTRHIADAQKAINTKAEGNKDLSTKNIDAVPLESEIDKLVTVWAIALEADSLELMDNLIQESAKDATAGIGASFDIEDQNIKDAIKAQQVKFAGQVSQESSKQIKKVISRSFDEGLSLKDLRKEIQKLGDQFNQNRATMIARTETVRAANQGAKLGYKQAGVTRLRYSAILDGNTSEICQALDGKIVGIDEHFLTEEEGFVLSNGKAMDLSYDQGVPNPPAHPNCRSTVIPEFDDNF